MFELHIEQSRLRNQRNISTDSIILHSDFLCRLKMHSESFFFSVLTSANARSLIVGTGVAS